MGLNSLPVLPLVLLLSGLPLLQACTSGQSAPTLSKLKQASYTGIDVGDLTLTDGNWQGQPYSDSSPVAPIAGLAEDFYLHADLDGDQAEEAVVLIWSSAGGTGSNSYLAVMDRHDGKIRNLSTALIGDRVKLQSALIDKQKVVLHVLQAAADDPMCCPTQLATRTWTLENRQLIEAAPVVTGKLPAE